VSESTPAAAKYVSLTTFRRTGQPVATPVWIAPIGGGGELAVITVDNVGKTKRLANTARVELRECDIRGRVEEGATVYAGTARVVRDPADVARVRRAITAKYGLAANLFEIVEPLSRFMPFVTPKPRAGILIRLD